MTDTNNNNHHHPQPWDRLELDPIDGQPYIEELRDKLLDRLAPCQTIEDVEDTLQKLYPESRPVALALEHARASLGAKSKDSSKNKTRTQSSSSTGASITGALQNISSAVAKVSHLVLDGVVGNKAENELHKFKLTFIRYIIDDALQLASDFVRRTTKSIIITRSDIRTAMHADKDLLELFFTDDKSLLMIQSHPILAQLKRSDKSGLLNHNTRLELITTTSYKQKVQNMVDTENEFIKCLKLIIYVFKAQLEKLPQIEREVSCIFGNIEDLLTLSTQFLTAFEDALESVGQSGEIPYVGLEIFDLAQAEEFHVYFTFAHQMLSRGTNWRQSFHSIVSNEPIMTSIRTAGQSFDLAVKHLLPNYFLITILQFFTYYTDICDLYELSKTTANRDDELALKETISILLKTKRAIEELLENEFDPRDIEPLDQKQMESIQAILKRRIDAELKHETNQPLSYMPPPEIYRFSEPDSPNNIQFESGHQRTITTGDGRIDTEQVPVIKWATLIKLVERLTYHRYYSDIVEAFLTTYRSFISDPEELLDLLIERFNVPDPPIWVVFPDFQGSMEDLPERSRAYYKQYLKRFRQEYSKPVKMRVMNVFKAWIKTHYYDFEKHPPMLDKLQKFLDEVLEKDTILKQSTIIKSLKKSIDQKKSGQIDDYEFMMSEEPPPILWWTAKAHEPEKFDILTLHPREFARQLTLFEFELFRAIKPSELINVHDLGLRSRKEDGGDAPNLSRMTRHFTLLSYWLRKRIVETDDFDKRSAIYSRAIEIMGVLREYNNFTGLLSFGSAIESAPIARLLHTKKSLTGQKEKILEDYRDLTRDHQKKLQRELKHCNPPCIPYLGSYQTKLIHAKEGNKTFIDEIESVSPTSTDEWNLSFSNSPATPISPGTPLPRSAHFYGPGTPSFQQNQFFGGPPAPSKMINFTKQLIRAGLVAEIRNYQNPPYCFSVQEQIRQFIESIETSTVSFVLSLNSASGDDTSLERNVQAMTKLLDDFLFEQSERIEPKNGAKPRSRPKIPDCWKSPGIKS